MNPLIVDELVATATLIGLSDDMLKSTKHGEIFGHQNGIHYRRSNPRLSITFKLHRLDASIRIALTTFLLHRYVEPESQSSSPPTRYAAVFNLVNSETIEVAGVHDDSPEGEALYNDFKSQFRAFGLPYVEDPSEFSIQ